MLEFYLNTTTWEWADRDGDPFRDSTPRMAYLSRETVKIIACTETPEIGGAGADPSAWTRDSSWAAISGIGAKITVDSDRIHKLKGELASEVAAGSVTGISATITGATTALIPESGVVRLYDAAGKYEAIAYSSRTVTDGTVTFSVDGTLTGSYAAGSVMDCDQAPYCEAMLDTAQSDLEQGEFVFDLAVDSQRLRSEMDYKDTALLPVAGLELLLFKTTGEVSEPIKAFLCDTFSITGTLGSVDFEAEPPEAMKDRISGTIAQLLAAGFSVEQRLTETGDTEFRFRSASAGGGWSSWITVQRGEKGDKGDAGNGLAFDASGPVSERAQYDAEAKGFVFFATDEGNFYVKNSATSADWSAAIPLRGATGPGVIADPVTEMAVADETWGDCRYLDAAFRQLSFRGRVRSLRRVSLETVSIDSGVTGNIVLVPVVNGSELSGTSFVVAVGAAPAVAEFALEVASGTLALRRDTDDERDTLKDSGNTPVTAVVLSVILEVQYDA